MQACGSWSAYALLIGNSNYASGSVLYRIRIRTDVGAEQYECGWSEIWFEFSFFGNWGVTHLRSKIREEMVKVAWALLLRTCLFWGVG